MRTKFYPLAGIKFETQKTSKSHIPNFFSHLKLSNYSRMTAQEYAQMGMDLATIGSNNSAILMYGNAIDIDPKNKDAYLARGTLLHKIGENVGAELDFEDYAKLTNATSWKSLGELGKGCLNTEHYGAAEFFLTKALKGNVADFDKQELFANRFRARLMLRNMKGVFEDLRNGMKTDGPLSSQFSAFLEDIEFQARIENTAKRTLAMGE